MKVGDLVKLSAYGKKLQVNRPVTRRDPVGIIVETGAVLFHVEWCVNETNWPPGLPYYRQDLKYAK
jgi:hypothetical protein